MNSFQLLQSLDTLLEAINSEQYLTAALDVITDHYDTVVELAAQIVGYTDNAAIVQTTA